MTRTLVLTALLIWAPMGSLLADNFGNGSGTFSIDFVTIGNPGNLADTDDGDIFSAGIQRFGSVGTAFRIGKFEISEQMIDKANAEGGLGITKNTRGSNKPATSVSWNEAARFVNWLNVSTGNAPAYKFAIQPTEVGYSILDGIQLWTPSDAGYNPNNLYRNRLAQYFLPSEDEWYKAAYYDPTSGSYYDYPTGSNLVPTPVASGTAAGTAVCNGQLGPADITLAGSLSPYGVMGLAGNAEEWDETDLDLVNDGNSIYRGVRGGTFAHSYSAMLASYRFNSYTTHEFEWIGFRVASSIPEPSTMLLAVCILTLLAGRCSRRYRHT